MDNKEFKKPATPGSAASRSILLSSEPASSSAGTSQSPRKEVENPAYRELNLAFNCIYKRERWEQFPEHIGSLIDHARRDRDSPGPTPESVWRDRDLENLTDGVGKGKVEDYFKNRVFSHFAGPTARSIRLHAVPNTHTRYKISYPCPDLLYGYSYDQVFSQRKLQFQIMEHELFANTELLICSFFDIEFKGESPSAAGSLWVATNQCLGGSVSCVNLAERINDRLRQYKSNDIKSINSAVFSVAMSGSEARLHVSWKQDERKYYLQEVRSFMLQMPDQYLQFRKYVRNILDWGMVQRLKEIQDSLDILLEESGKRASEAANYRPPFSDKQSASKSGNG
ncbi:hypothetical protein MMC07_000606 [Pseudocyphellaria aurata]|nr:hypothetical protein [Pseudocyphellaria aurata]